ncbi:MAG: hypothetical protein QOG60_1112 [Frankiaceae bacterium]|jgi:cytochrome b|nr:hypothetical protein [Frankiaceae bacterium]MDQ1671887.1 hypothetical protein [Frankiaceae bacterium]
MVLTRRVAGLLLAFGVWSWIIWPTFLKNIWNDDRSFAPGGGPTGFLVVHALLTAASLAFGTAIGVLGYRGLRHRTDAPAIERV